MPPMKVTDLVDSPVLVTVNNDGTLAWESPHGSLKPKYKKVKGPIQLEPVEVTTTVTTTSGSLTQKAERGGIISISLNDGEC